ncbi:MAG: hypothetical protein V3U88_08970 [Methylococcales bacterium]
MLTAPPLRNHPQSTNPLQRDANAGVADKPIVTLSGNAEHQVCT